MWGQFLNSSPRGLSQETQHRGRGSACVGGTWGPRWTVLVCIRVCRWQAVCRGKLLSVPEPQGCHLAVVKVDKSVLRWRPSLPTPKAGVFCREWGPAGRGRRQEALTPSCPIGQCVLGSQFRAWLGGGGRRQGKGRPAAWGQDVWAAVPRDSWPLSLSFPISEGHTRC